jgi:hypothetical protein
VIRPDTFIEAVARHLDTGERRRDAAGGRSTDPVGARWGSDRVSRALQTAPEPPVRKLTQLFTREELRSVGIERPDGVASAEEFHMRWADREPETVSVVRDLLVSQVDHVVCPPAGAPRCREFDPSRMTIT